MAQWDWRKFNSGDVCTGYNTLYNGWEIFKILNITSSNKNTVVCFYSTPRNFCTLGVYYGLPHISKWKRFDELKKVEFTTIEKLVYNAND